MSYADGFLERLDAVASAVDGDIREIARSGVLDTVGVMVAGAAEVRRTLPAIDRLNVPVDRRSASRPVGFGARGDTFTAALLNGISAHWLDLDDGHRYGAVHPGAPVIACLMALASEGRIDGEGFLRGVVVGYEASIALATAMQPGLRDRGFHATGPCGTVGAAMGAAEALGLPRDQRRAVLAAAVTGSAGLLTAIQDASDLKATNAGNAAANGLRAVHLGSAGFAAPRDALGGRFGMLEAMTDTADPAALLEPHASGPLIRTTYVKPYPACRHAHGPVELALRLRAEHRLVPETVRAVTVRTYRQAVLLHDHREVQGATDARMSTPFAVATALVRGELQLDDFSGPALADRTVLDLAARVAVIEDPGLSARVPEMRGAQLVIERSDGGEVSDSVDLPLGEPERPLPSDAVEDKFLMLWASAGRDAAEGRSAMAAVAALEASLPVLVELVA